MKTQLSTLALLAGLAAAGAAFAQPVGGPDAKGNAPLKAPHEVNNGSASHGANSFTEGQARTHIERAGFSNVSGLTQDGGVWRGTAMRNGASMPVAMDYKGNVTTGGASGGGSAHHARSATTTTRTAARPTAMPAPATNEPAPPMADTTTTTTAETGVGAGAGMAMHHHRHHRHMRRHFRHFRHHRRHHMHHHGMRGGIPGERMDGQGAAMSGVDRNQNGVSDKEDRATGR